VLAMCDQGGVARSRGKHSLEYVYDLY